MKITPEYHILINIKKENGKILKQVIMSYITEDEEIELDNIAKNSFVKINRGNKTFTITPFDIICYGEVDFHDKKDLLIMNGFKFLNHLSFVGKAIPANYDYETHTASSLTKQMKWTETFQPMILCKYAHGCLNKPKRIVLFNQE